MKLYLRAEAADEIEAIATYHLKRSLTAAENMLTDVYELFDILLVHPEFGRPTGNGIYRKAVTPKYGFSIQYEILEDVIEIVTVYRYQDRNYS